MLRLTPASHAERSDGVVDAMVSLLKYRCILNCYDCNWRNYLLCAKEAEQMEKVKCALCGEPMPAGEEMFKYHGYSGNCPKPLPKSEKGDSMTVAELIVKLSSIEDKTKKVKVRQYQATINYLAELVGVFENEESREVEIMPG